MPTAYLCDFDGTVSPTDIGAALVRRFSVGSEVERNALLARWKAGALGHRELTEAECGWMRVTRSDAIAFARGFQLDAGFAGFARRALAQGDAVMVVSEGLDVYVQELLERAGLGDLPYAANHARFAGDRVIPEFPHSDPRCAQCGNCKAGHVRAYRARGYRTTLVGDGGSDRCGAREADRVYARGDLLAWCATERIPAQPFTDFAALSEVVLVSSAAER